MAGAAAHETEGIYPGCIFGLAAFAATTACCKALCAKYLQKLMGNSVTAAQVTLDHLVKVRILVPQLDIRPCITESYARLCCFAASARKAEWYKEWDK